MELTKAVPALPHAGDLEFAARELEARAHQLETGIYTFPPGASMPSLASNCREIASRLRHASCVPLAEPAR